jgi:hypothetical protein
VIKCKKPPGKKCRFLAVVGWKYATLKPVWKEEGRKGVRNVRRIVEGYPK